MARSRTQRNQVTARRSHAASSGLIRAVTILGTLVSLGAFAAVISLRPPTAAGELRIPVIVQGGDEEALAGVQFDVHYDPTQYTLVSVTPGAIATEAGKEVVFAETIPGQGRVLVTGFNNTTLADGQVATLVLRPLDGESAHDEISIARFLATDPDGNSVPLDYEDIYGYAPTAPEEQEPEKETAPEETDTGESPEVGGSSDSPAQSDPEPSSDSDSSTRNMGGYYPGGLSDGKRAAQTESNARDSRPRTEHARSSQTSHAQRSSQSRQQFFSGNHARVEHSGTTSNGDVQSSLSTPRAPSVNRPTAHPSDEPRETTRLNPNAPTPPGPRLALGGATVAQERLGSLGAGASVDEDPVTAPRSLQAIGLSLVAPLTVLALLGAAHHLLQLRRRAHGRRKKG